MRRCGLSKEFLLGYLLLSRIICTAGSKELYLQGLLQGNYFPRVHVLEIKSFFTVAQPVSPMRILGSDAGLNNTSLIDKERRKRNDRARGYEPPNRMRSLEILQNAELACAEDASKTFELSLL